MEEECFLNRESGTFTMEIAIDVKKANTWFRKAKCAHCKYRNTCYGIQDWRVRAWCTSRVTDGGRAYDKEPPRWSEMSYYHD